MPHHDFRLSTRWLLLAIAVIGLNLAGAVTTSRYYPIEPISVGVDDYGRGAPWFVSDGSIHVHRTVSRKGKPMVRVLYRRLPLTTTQIWSPALACASITVLAITVSSRFPAQYGQVRPSSRGRGTWLRHRRARSVIRWMAIVSALIGLTFAGAAYRPPPDHLDEDIARKLSDITDIAIDIEGGTYYVGGGGSGTIRGPMLCRDGARCDITEPDPNIQRPGKVLSRPIRTIVFKEDGRILGYEVFPPDLDPTSSPHSFRPPSRRSLQRWFPVPFEWAPGPMPSRSYVIRDQLRSPLEMRSPILASAATCILVLVLLWREARSQRTVSSSAADTYPNPSPL